MSNMNKKPMTPAEIEWVVKDRCAKEAENWDADCVDPMDIAEAILAIPPMFGDVPAGWQLVPVEPTPKMKDAV